ncbi:hypothetical protein NDU88_000253 [Pleurodeles waltl]|uniref:KRAB domain-containing protein n=1 Tax=Pleurodeles waltl TaxID=8319 RepID=A0AAV7VSY3_PLEWA|nr:hypothetical protein NDU88_000253 [Pleurodeles waltl]
MLEHNSVSYLVLFVYIAKLGLLQCFHSRFELTATVFTFIGFFFFTCPLYCDKLLTWKITMKTRKDMSQRNSDQAPITFYEVAAYFSEEEWKLLHEWQKELYKSVMKEIQQAVISLGPLIATSVFALKPKTKDKMDQIDNMDSEISIMNSDLRDETVKSDMPLRKTRMAAKHLKAAPDTDPKDIHDDPVTGHMIVKPDAAFTTSKACQYQKEASDTYTRDSQDGLTSGYQTLNSNNNLRMVQELEPKFMDDYGSTEIDSNIHPCLGHEDPSAVSFSVKEEGGTYFMDHPDAEEIENITETPRFPFHRNEIEASLREHRGKEESSRSLKSVPNVTTLPSIGINEEGETYQIEINGHRKREKMIGPTDIEVVMLLEKEINAIVRMASSLCNC